MSLPRLSDADVHVPSNGGWAEKTSRARIVKYALSPVGSQPLWIAASGGDDDRGDRDDDRGDGEVAQGAVVAALAGRSVVVCRLLIGWREEGGHQAARIPGM